MKKILLNTAALVLSAFTINTCLHAQSNTKQFGGFKSPESVGAYKKHLYVSNMGANNDPSQKDGDGFISQVNRNSGTISEEKFITGLNSPKGMLVGHGYILVADVDKVVVFRIKDKKKVWETDLSKEGIVYANDLAIRGWGSAYVSSTDKNAIYIAKANGKVKKLAVKGNLEGANGIYKKCGKLFVANYGRGTSPNGSYGRIGLCSKKYKVFNSGGVYDGIAPLGGKLLVSDWRNTTDGKGRLIVYRKCKKEEVAISLERTINGPSDLFVDRKYKAIWIPGMNENMLIQVSLKDVKKQACKAKGTKVATAKPAKDKKEKKS